MKILLYILMIETMLWSSELHTVFQKKIFLDKNTTGKLILQEENIQRLAEKKAKILIDYENNDTQKEFTFIDSSKKFPILYFNNLFFNTKIAKNINLVNSVNVFDTDNDGRNEIFIYGTSHYGGSGLVGKLVYLKQDIKGDIKKLGIIEANDNFEMHYIQQENIIVVAQYIWRQGIEAHYGDKHQYKLYIYDLNAELKKIPIYITEKKYNDSNSSVIDDNLKKILDKYNLYEKNKISQEEENKYKEFVINYWDRISQKDFTSLQQVYSDDIDYYTKKLTKKKVINDKKKFLNNIKKIKFNLDDFLIYKQKDIIKIEYIKTYNIDEGMSGGRTHAIMELRKINNKLLIINESDINILKQRKDLD